MPERTPDDLPVVVRISDRRHEAWDRLKATMAQGSDA